MIPHELTETTGHVHVHVHVRPHTIIVPSHKRARAGSLLIPSCIPKVESPTDDIIPSSADHAHARAWKSQRRSLLRTQWCARDDVPTLCRSGTSSSLTSPSHFHRDISHLRTSMSTSALSTLTSSHLSSQPCAKRIKHNEDITRAVEPIISPFTIRLPSSPVIAPASPSSQATASPLSSSPRTRLTGISITVPHRSPLLTITSSPSTTSTSSPDSLTPSISFSSTSTSSPSYPSLAPLSLNTPTLTPTEQPLFPTLHPRYTLLHTLHTTVLGAIVHALDTRDDTHVAIKICRRERDVMIHDDAQNEIEMLLRVMEQEITHTTCSCSLGDRCTGSHHICPLLSHLMDDHHTFLILPFFSAGDLFTHVTSQPSSRLSEQAVRPLFHQLITAVSHIHSLGIAHRDLSLENVMLTSTSHDHYDITLIDFGVASLNPHHPSTSFPCRVSHTDPRLGKLQYMSPEVASGLPHDAYAADIWSLGVILFCLITGRPPFTSGEDFWGYHMSAEGWMPTDVQLSDETRHLLLSLLCPEHQRITMAQLKAHTWWNQK